MRHRSGIFVEEQEQMGHLLCQGSRNVNGDLNSNVSELRAGLLPAPTLWRVGTVKLVQDEPTASRYGRFSSRKVMIGYHWVGR